VLKLFQERGEGRIKENDGGGKFKIYIYIYIYIYDLIYCKNFCKCHNIPPLSTITKKESVNQGEHENI
jgi:predicted nucleic acid-binding Zn finger protein